MDKPVLQTLKGFRDFLPKDAKKRQFVIEIFKKTAETYGFEPIETPAIEYQSLLLGKSGEETDSLVYKFTDLGGREVGLRYDQTVPTARVLSMYRNDLPLPFRRYQIQTVWRAEKPQSGRFREFLQLDADIYGTSSFLADAEIIALANSVYKNLGFKKYNIYINDRNILYELMRYASVPENLYMSTISQVDKLDRKSKDEVTRELLNLGLNQESVDHLFHHLDEAQASENIKNIIKVTQQLGVEKDKLIFQARLARGLDYYTSTIFEIKIDDYKAGSVLGGGRYDNLIEKLSQQNIPAVGFGLGFDRTIEAMDQFDLFPKNLSKTSTKVLVTIFTPDLIESATKVITTLRENNISCEIYPDENTKLEKQLKYADKKGIRWLIVIGPDEVNKNSVILKNLETGKQEDVKLNNLSNEILRELKTLGFSLKGELHTGSIHP